MNDLYVLDGSGYIFRAYYGLPPLHDKDGHNVNAVFGFFRMLFKLREMKPSYFVIARDSPTRTIRKEQFTEYKANRVALPDEFKRQMRLVHETIDRVKIPYITAPGYEADDIIASLIKECCVLDDVSKLAIVTSDKDLKQLLRDKVQIFDAAKNERTDEQKFIQEYGFTPIGIIDYLSLVGDSSDNIPGVKGIGPKQASDLIQKRGSLEGVYEHLDKISESTRNKLIEGKESAFHSKNLITLMDVPELTKAQLPQRKRNVDFALLKEVLVEEFGFHSLEKLIDEIKKKYQA